MWKQNWCNTSQKNKPIKQKRCQMCLHTVLEFSSSSIHTSIISTVWGTEGCRLDEVYINSVTSEPCVYTQGNVKVNRLLFTNWLHAQISAFSSFLCLSETWSFISLWGGESTETINMECKERTRKTWTWTWVDEHFVFCSHPGFKQICRHTVTAMFTCSLISFFE